jgi:hypothetical protein
VEAAELLMEILKQCNIVCQNVSYQSRCNERQEHEEMVVLMGLFVFFFSGFAQFTSPFCCYFVLVGKGFMKAQSVF